MIVYLHSRSKRLMNLKIFATVHSLMNDTNLNYSCQAHLPMQYASNIELIRQMDPGGVIDSESQRSRTCKTNLLFAPLAVRVHTGYSAFPFYTPTKPLTGLHIKYK